MPLNIDQVTVIIDNIGKVMTALTALKAALESLKKELPKP